VGKDQFPLEQTLYDVSRKSIRRLTRFTVATSIDDVVNEAVDLVLFAWDYAAFKAESGQLLVQDLAAALPDAAFAALHPGAAASGLWKRHH
jgi:hypothetical protein